MTLANLLIIVKERGIWFIETGKVSGKPSGQGIP